VQFDQAGARTLISFTRASPQVVRGAHGTGASLRALFVPV
jgi:hypothetical protein